ncbi:MAG TPA: hypothetical protein VGI17_00425 [Solirubrobacterales bacterium]|jgi:DNA-directed RNA polymerase specialized sigma24 family protein
MNRETGAPNRAARFEALRPQLTRVAYGMLGNLADGLAEAG